MCTMVGTFTHILATLEPFRHLLSKSHRLLQALSRIYHDIIEFCLEATKARNPYDVAIPQYLAA